ncbi:hypothetical protein KDK95_26585 [Actinospica sp. MGRD01-02]|uniref:Uncharacterized protein n=1 Tax=Actinospica acidithermotolerans TaxID=2828514 RepID=A0A941INX3_9ACTN|nr:hypothetical protein [Actinospica acidithermotolerans]MBR7829901.1 hypothetical protein [Actinospica acidithermotolerans]
MKLSSLTPEEASLLSVRNMGLTGDSVGLTSREFLTASLRRAASFICPATPNQLVSAVLEVLQPLVPEGEVTRDELNDILDLVIAGGDLLELIHQIEGSARLLYLGPPSYIEQEPGKYLLVGVRPFGASLLDAELSDEIEYEEHTRIIRLDATSADDQLSNIGLQRIDRERWIARPRVEAAELLVGRVTKRLDAANDSGEIERLQVLDPAAGNRFYRGRWRSPKPADTGDFLARRPQAYGADLWCMVRLLGGASTKVVDFPIDDPLAAGRDEAWRVQMAIDSLRGAPQQYRTERATSNNAAVVKFYSPIPAFAERYLRLVGLALGKVGGALFAFRVPSGAMPGLHQLLTEMLWMDLTNKEESP